MLLFQSQVGSHRQYTHPLKPGKVTIPFHCKDIPKGTESSILKDSLAMAIDCLQAICTMQIWKLKMFHRHLVLKLLILKKS
ncbi:type II toxin-antitoxin system HicA family toxin [Coprococcus comes]|uniref:type II toxin-antitoxin system HicA family toxin n=1 Tax=Coprococcus comes TaxID=410072 RepID=UPI00189AE19C